LFDISPNFFHSSFQVIISNFCDIDRLNNSLGFLRNRCKTRGPFLLKFLKDSLLLGMNMVHELMLIFPVRIRQHNNSRLNPLVDVPLPKWWRQHNNAWITFLGKAINAVVVVLVEHPELKFLNKFGFLQTFLDTQQR
jgi:hypothetical protein